MSKIELAKKMSGLAALKWSVERLIAFTKKAFAIIQSGDQEKIEKLKTLLDEALEILQKTEGMDRQYRIELVDPVIRQIELL